MSIRAPRDVLMRMTPFFVSASVLSLIRYSVPLLSGQCRLMMSAPEQLLDGVDVRDAAAAWRWVRVVRDDLRAEAAREDAPVCSPMRPVPTMPIVFPAMFMPSRPSSRKLPSRTRLYALWYLRTTVRSMPTVNSATAAEQVRGHARDDEPEARGGGEVDVVVARAAQHDEYLGGESVGTAGGGRHHTTPSACSVYDDGGVADVVDEDADGVVPRGEDRGLLVKEGVEEGEIDRRSRRGSPG